MMVDCGPSWVSPMNIYILWMRTTLQVFMCPWSENVWQVLRSGSIRQGFRSQPIGIWVFLPRSNGYLFQQKHILFPSWPHLCQFFPCFPFFHSIAPSPCPEQTNYTTFVWASALSLAIMSQSSVINTEWCNRWQWEKFLENNDCFHLLMLLWREEGRDSLIYLHLMMKFFF